MIELYFRKNQKSKIFFINPDDENINNMIEFIKNKTGVYIDPYSDTKLYPSHQKIAISFLESLHGYDNLIHFLNESIKLDEIVYCIGD